MSIEVDSYTPPADGFSYLEVEQKPKEIDIAELLGVNEIDRSSVDERWALAPNGMFYVAKTNADHARGFENRVLTAGLAGWVGYDGEQSLVYVASADALNYMKHVAGVTGGFVFAGQEVQPEPTPGFKTKIKFADFQRPRLHGIWTIQTPVVG